MIPRPYDDTADRSRVVVASSLGELSIYVYSELDDDDVVDVDAAVTFDVDVGLNVLFVG